MQQGSILELDRVEKDFIEDKDVRAVSRLLLFLPKVIPKALIACLIMFLAGLVYGLAQYFLTGYIPYFLPEASQVISFVRSSTGLLAMGSMLAMILFVFAFRVIFGKKNEKINDEQAGEANGSIMFQAMSEIEEGETPVQVLPLPIKKKALKKIYGKCREQKETKNEENIRNKYKPNNEPRSFYPDYNSGQRSNVVMFKQKRPSFQRGVHRSIKRRVATAANIIKWSTQTETVN